MDGHMDVRMGGLMYRNAEGLTDGWREGQNNGRTDTHIYRQMKGL